MLCIGSGRQPAESWLRSFLVVFTRPDRNDGLGVQQAGEPVLVEAFVAQPTVERFDVGVLVGLAGLDQSKRDVVAVGPLLARAEN